MQGRFMHHSDLLSMAVKISHGVRLGEGRLFLCPGGLQGHQGTKKAQWGVVRMLLAVRHGLTSDFSAAVLM